MGIVNHPNWLMFIREPVSSNDSPWVAIFINIRLSSLCFSLRKDVINYRDILLLSFLNNGNSFWIMNVYSDSSHSTIKYLKNIELNIRNLLIMTEDFNIHNSLWDSLYSFHSSISDNLFAIADSFNLFLSFPTEQVPTRFSDNANNLNSVLVSYPKLWNMSETCLTSIRHQIPTDIWSYSSKTLLVAWYFIMDLILPKVHGYFALFESKSAVIFICIHCLIISFKLCKFTWILHGVFSSPNLNSYSVSLMKHLLGDLF